MALSPIQEESASEAGEAIAPMECRPTVPSATTTSDIIPQSPSSTAEDETTDSGTIGNDPTTNVDAISTQKKVAMFDLDNTLILSEGPAFLACPQLCNELLEMKSIQSRYRGEKLTADFMGQTYKMMMVSLADKFGFELTQADKDHFKQREEELVIEAFKREGGLCEGVLRILHQLRESGVMMALVSSSSLHRIQECMRHVGILDLFDADKVFSAATMCEHGKPDPDVYLYALHKLGVEAKDCITVEDSRVGMMAAHEAGIECIGYTGAFLMNAMQQQLQKDFEDLGAVAVMHDWRQYASILAHF